MIPRSVPLRLILQYALTILMLWLMIRFLPQYLLIEGSILALPAVAALLTLLNLFVRPILKIVTFPLKLFATLLAIVLANGAFLWLLERITERFDPTVASFIVDGGATGWIVVALLLGFGNWILHHILR